MSDDRRKKRERIWPRGDPWWYPADRYTLPYAAAGLGFGLLAIGLFGLFAGSLVLSVLALLLGTVLLAYGIRHY